MADSIQCALVQGAFVYAQNLTGDVPDIPPVLPLMNGNYLRTKALDNLLQVAELSGVSDGGPGQRICINRKVFLSFQQKTRLQGVFFIC